MKAKEPIRLDIGCGQNKKPEFVGMDICKLPGVDIVHDVRKTPWPLAAESVSEAYANQFFEHLDANERFRFMDELWRVLVMGGKATLITPHYASMRAIQDPTHKWPPVCEASYQYFNEGWRRLNGLTHYPVSCNFDYVYAYGFIPEVAARTEEVRLFHAKHYINTVNDLWVTVTKTPKIAGAPTSGRELVKKR